METKIESKAPVVRNKYTAQFKGRALGRADRDGIPTVAKDLGLAEPMLYTWRAKRRQTGQPLEEQKLQQAETARLKRVVPAWKH
ncbi:MAG: transposase [Methylovulum sp.]|nr:transposase [Methylovulum sp.]